MITSWVSSVLALSMMTIFSGFVVICEALRNRSSSRADRLKVTIAIAKGAVELTGLGYLAMLRLLVGAGPVSDIGHVLHPSAQPVQ